MGGGKAKPHESFAVAPSVGPAVPEGMSGVTESDLASALAPAGPAASSLEQFDTALTVAQGVDSTEGYATLKEAAAAANTHLANAAEAGLPPQLVSESQNALKHTTAVYLGGLEPAQLQSLAAAEGFEHPGLVGFNAAEGKGLHPLVHWLDPAYPSTSPSKLAIQAKAAERYAALAAGETIGGLSWADVQAAELQLSIDNIPPGLSSWPATPTGVVNAQSALHQAAAEFKPYPPGAGVGLAEMVAAENHLATASCPELGPSLDAAKAAGKAAVDKALSTVSPSVLHSQVASLVETAQGEGIIGSPQAKYLSTSEQLALLRASTPVSERAGLVAAGEERSGQFRKAVELKAAYQASFAGGSIALASLDSDEGKAQAISFAATAGAYFEQRKTVAAWGATAAGSSEITAVVGQPYSFGYQGQELSKEFRAWAKTQKLADLRAVATSMGMSADGASRAEVQNYVAASWDSTLNKASIAAAVAAKAPAVKAAPTTASATAAAPKTTPAPKMAPPVTAAPVPSAKPTAAPEGLPTPKSFAAKHLQIVESLKAHQAVTADLPARPPSEEVSSWSFGPATAAHLGGAHTKSLHTAPDGSVWMFKPDKTAAGARAHAESAASEIFSRTGVPSVAVYARSIDGKPGSIQPLVEGATTLSADPKSWSQADVDNLVRYHVAAWAVGDHDGNPQNVIRTPSGGLCPVDQGQAFKFFGRDKLATDYHPNNSFGSVPVFHQAYSAAKTDSLAKGVHIRPEAALPTIKAFETMPEAQYRAILGPVASEGVKHKVHWVEPMRAAAQKRLGKTKVSDAEVAEEFLHTALARKNSLRSDFASFFSGMGFGGANKIEKVA